MSELSFRSHTMTVIDMVTEISKKIVWMRIFISTGKYIMTVVEDA